MPNWCKEMTHWKKTLMMGKTEGKRKRGQQKMRLLDSINDSVDVSMSKLSGKDREAWHAAVLGVAKSWPTGKDPDAGKYGRQEKGTAENEIVRWHQWFNGHEFEQTLGDSGGQKNLECCSLWGRTVRHNLATEQQQQWGNWITTLCTTIFPLFGSSF